MSPKVDLKLDWCSYEAAKYAVEHWHYSRTVPVSKRNYIGVWEDGTFIGVVIFSCGSGNATSGLKFGLRKLFDLVELQRVALRNGHKTPVTRILKIALKMLRRQCPGLKGVVSFADPHEHHHGGIYQGGNWIYLGQGSPVVYQILTDGRVVNGRVTNRQWGRHRKAKYQMTGQKEIRPGKYKYLWAFDETLRSMAFKIAKPYPKRAASIVQDAPSDQGGEGGLQPTAALHRVIEG